MNIKFILFATLLGMVTAAQGEESFRVKNGDSLSEIAARYSYEGAASEQKIMAIYEKNKEAFNFDNINSLHLGSVIYMPSSEEVLAQERRQSLLEMRRHHKEWKAGIKRERLVQVNPPEEDTALIASLDELKAEVVEIINDIKASQNVLQKNILEDVVLEEKVI